MCTCAMIHTIFRRNLMHTDFTERESDYGVYLCIRVTGATVGVSSCGEESCAG